MATNLENAEAALAAAYEELASLDATKAGGKPNPIGFKGVDHAGYLDSLLKRIAFLERRVNDLSGGYNELVHADT